MLDHTQKLRLGAGVMSLGGLGLRAEWLCLDVAQTLRFETRWLGCPGVLEDWAMSYELSLPTM